MKELKESATMPYTKEATRLRELIKLTRLPQKKAAEALSVSERTLRAYLSGKAHIAPPVLNHFEHMISCCQYLKRFPGYRGLFTTDHARGAYKNGARVVKVGTDEGDAHADGDLGTVLGSLATDTCLFIESQARFIYFVEWDKRRGVAVGVRDHKLALAK